MSVTDSGPNAFKNEPECNDIAPEILIFVPGIFEAPSLNSIKTISEKLVRGFRVSSPPCARFTLEQRGVVHYGQGSKADSARITRTDRSDKPSIDVYDLQYQPEMLAEYDAMNALSKVTTFILALLNCVGRVTAISFAAMRGRPVQHALNYGIPLYFAMWVYVVSLIVTAIQAAASQAAVQTAWAQLLAPVTTYYFALHPPYDLGLGGLAGWLHQISASKAGFAFSEWRRLAIDVIAHSANFAWSIAPRISLVLTILGLLIPGSLAAISGAATRMVAILDYLNLGARRNRVTGELGDLIRHLSQWQYDVYGSVSLRIVAHSFGCIVVADALCLNDEAVGDYAKSILGACTIGNPLTIIDAFWSRHFSENKCQPLMAPILNVWSQSDALSSSLTAVSAAKRIHPHLTDFDYSRAAGNARPTLWDIFTGFYFRAHAMYWDSADHPDASCFNRIVAFFYTDTPLLRDAAGCTIDG